MGWESFGVGFILGPLLQGQTRMGKPKSACNSLWGGHIIFTFSGVRCPASTVRNTWFPVISRKSIYPMFTKFGMGVYWVNSLHGIAFGEDSSIAN